MTLLDRLAAYASGVEVASLDAELVWKAKAHILDTLGLGLAARGTHADALFAGAGRLVASADAMWLGAAADVLGLDDFDEQTRTHPGAVIIPALLGDIGSARDSEVDRVAGPVHGRQLLRGAVVGYEVLCRLGELLGSQDMQKRGLHPTTVLGTPAAACAIAAMHDQPPPQIAAATGLAASFASGLFEFDAQGLVRDLQVGWAASSAVTAHALSQQGYQPSPSVLDRPRGMVQAFGTGTATDDAADEAFGPVPRLLRVSFKVFSHFTDLHPLAKAVLDLSAESPLVTDDIESARITLPSRTAGRLTERFPPTTAAEARRCPRFTFAAVAHHHDPDEPYDPLLSAFSPSAIEDPRLLELGRKVEWSTTSAEQRPEAETCVDVRLAGGAVRHARADGYPGDGRHAETRWGWNEAEARFWTITGTAVARERAAPVVELVRGLETQEDMQEALEAIRRAYR